MNEGPVTQFSHNSIALLKQQSNGIIHTIRSGNINILPASTIAQLIEEWQARFDNAVSSMQDALNQDFR